MPQTAMAVVLALVFLPLGLAKVTAVTEFALIKRTCSVSPRGK
ncbi:MULTISPECIES: hypothetical protein [unclassified Streptomyces]|jgi:hypothetical protein|nr:MULTISPECIES: hypothetical protein [unclassified Streptomyces]MDH6502503.1 hypothetical protein [Streptomyces sp. SAI-149]